MDFESLHVLDAAEARLLYEEVVMQQCYFADGFHVHSGDVVVDCGANIGLLMLLYFTSLHSFTLLYIAGIFSLLCLARASALTLIALEPIPLTFQTLQMNLRGCAQLLANNVTAIECAVAAEAAETDFLFFPSSPGESCAVLYASEREEQQQRLIEAAAASDVSELFDALMLAQESIAAPTVHTCSSHTLEQILTHLGVAEVDFLKVRTSIRLSVHDCTRVCKYAA